MLPKSSSSRIVFGAILVAVLAAGAMSASGIVPGTSADVGLRAYSTEPSDAVMDPWDSRWSKVGPVQVVLSAQNATKPLGGGEVSTVKARALQDGSRLYVSLEWSDKTRDTSVNGQTVFADSAAMEMPTSAAVAIPSFCMGQVDASVNIWHWKAAWQEDLDSGYATGKNRYPDGFVDGNPLAGDPAFITARAAGNPLSQTSHASPVENLVAGGFGTLTTADVQDVAGRGVWKDGRWRVVFARPLTTSTGYPSLAVGDTTNIAFAVWDGSKGNRDGLKSVSQFMNLQVSASTAPKIDGSFPLWGWGVIAAIAATLALSLGAAYMGRGQLRA